ncbi:hypothetical protein IIZ77_02470 [Candidatus Saccharibacteria bacterium]|nr:hypothetical protein [Candidatus Saccharibacteria bacterium]
MPDETPETGYGDGSYDYWVNIGGYNYNYVSKIGNTVTTGEAPNTTSSAVNVAAFVYAGLQFEYATATTQVTTTVNNETVTTTVPLNNRTGKVITEMQQMTPGVCDLTNMWKNTSSLLSDAVI